MRRRSYGEAQQVSVDSSGVVSKSQNPAEVDSWIFRRRRHHDHGRPRGSYRINQAQN
ncbi:MAG: hypothetical protein LZF86_110041 [Nitrospira sp.]|nr:MAG: hypothetical protein LZF86_110041 [Nitrospira sp.]